MSEDKTILICESVTNTAKSVLVRLIRELEKQGVVIVETVDVDSIQGQNYDMVWIDEMNKTLSCKFGENEYKKPKQKAQWKREIKGRK